MHIKIYIYAYIHVYIPSAPAALGIQVSNFRFRIRGEEMENNKAGIHKKRIAEVKQNMLYSRSVVKQERSSRGTR